jgi:hypothetical protein
MTVRESIARAARFLAAANGWVVAEGHDFEHATDARSRTFWKNASDAYEAFYGDKPDLDDEATLVAVPPPAMSPAPVKPPPQGPRSYRIVSENGAVDAVVAAGKGAKAIARSMGAAGATADPGVPYRVLLGYGEPDPVWEPEPLIVYLAEPGEDAYGTPRKRRRSPR